MNVAQLRKAIANLPDKDITPDQPPSVIDAEVIQPELPGGTA